MEKPLCIVLVILILSTSLNQGQKIKSNQRRAMGIIPYPRTGRHLAMASFSRPDGNAGMVNYPRVGRSGDANSPREFHSEPGVDSYRQFDPEISQDFYYLGHDAVDYEESRKRLEPLTNEGMWLQSQSAPETEKEHHRIHRCNQQIDGPWALLFASREMGNLDQQPVHKFIPILTREVDHEGSATSNIVS